MRSGPATSAVPAHTPGPVAKSAPRVYGVDMSKNPDYDDKDLIQESPTRDHLAEVYSEMVTPDIDEMNDHAAALEKEAETEPDKL